MFLSDFCNYFFLSPFPQILSINYINLFGSSFKRNFLVQKKIKGYKRVKST